MAADIKDWSANDLENLVLDDINLSREQGGEVAKLMGAIRRKFDDVDVQIKGVAGAYTYKGTVDTVDDLPMTGNSVGDVYNVTTGDAQGNYAWDGAEWDKTGDSLVDVDGARVIATGSTTPRTLGARFADAVRPEDFGAVGDGVADDADALQAAIDGAVGKTLWLSGVYNCASKRISIPSKTCMIGSSGTKIVRGGNYGTLCATVALAGENTIYDIVLDGIVFDGNGGVYDAINYDLIYMSELPTHDVVIKNCTFKDVIDFHAIDLNRCNRVLIENCRFEGWKLVHATDTPYNAQREAIQLDGFDVDDVANRNRNIIVSNCWFGASDTEGFGPYPAAVGNHGWFNSDAGEGRAVGCHDIFIDGNTFSGLSNFAVTCLGLKNVQITNNRAENCYGFVNIYAMNVKNTPAHNCVPENIVIANNIIESDEGTVNGIGVSVNIPSGYDTDSVNVLAGLPKNITITNNVFKNTPSAIFAYAGNSIKVESNIFDNNINVFRAYVCCNSYMSGNIVKNGGSIAFSGFNGTYTSSNEARSNFAVCNNIFRNPKTPGIQIVNSTRHVVVKGNSFSADAETATDASKGFINIDQNVQNAFVVDNIAYVDSSNRTYAFVIDGSVNRSLAANNHYIVNGVDTAPYNFS